MTRTSLVLSMALAGGLVAAPAPPAAAAPKPQAFAQVLAGGSFGDGLDARRATLDYPQDLAVGPDGNVYIADFFHHQVRVVLPDGTIDRVAGTSEGYGGDHGPALRARLNRPSGLGFDPQGRLLIADAGNSRIRRVDLQSGHILTVAGNGKRAYGGDGGPATDASIAFATDVLATADGSVYIADAENRRVRRVLPNGTITTVAGDGTRLNDFDGVPASTASVQPISLALMPDGDLLVADEIGCRVRRIDRSSGTIGTVAGDGCGYGGDGGPATDAQFNGITGIDADAAGNVYITDANNHRVRMVDAAGVVRTIAGSGDTACDTVEGPAGQADVLYPYGVDVAPDGTVYFNEQGFFFGNCRGRAFRLSGGQVSVVAGNGGYYAGGSGDPARSINFAGIEAVAWGPDGQPYFADPRGIWTIEPDGTAVLLNGGGYGDADGPLAEAKFEHPTGLTFDAAGRLWVADASAGKIKVIADGGVTTVAGNADSRDDEDGPALEVRIFPMDLVPLADGTVIFTDGSARLRRLRGGQVETLGGENKNNYLADPGDGGPVQDALFRNPWGLALAPNGRDLYIADRQHQRIRRLDLQTGIIGTAAGDGGEESRGDGTLATLASFSTPEDVAVDAAGNLFVTDGKNGETFQPGGYVVRHVAPNGMVSRLAGTGISGVIGDGPALQEPLVNPTAVALGPDGLLVGDGTTVRLVTPAQGAWPHPARTVRCDPYFVDVEGDARAQLVTSVTYSPSYPWIDLLAADVRTTAADITVTMDFLDLSERVYVQPTAEVGTAWAWTYFFKVKGQHYYMTALAPGSATNPASVAFEYGTAGLGRGSATKQVTRKGAATGTFDMAKDRVTITAPLSVLGLKPGDRVLYHEATGGEMVDTTPITRFVNPDDTTFIDGFLPGTARSFRIGERCPEDLS